MTERIFVGLVTKDSTVDRGFYLRNLQMDKIYDSHVMLKDFENKEVIVKISDMEKKPGVKPVFCLNLTK